MSGFPIILILRLCASLLCKTSGDYACPDTSFPTKIAPDKDSTRLVKKRKIEAAQFHPPGSLCKIKPSDSKPTSFCVQSINTLLPDLQRRHDNPPADMHRQQAVSHCLQALFGQSAEFLKPCLFRDGKLVIIAQAPVWATHIRHRHERLIQAFSQRGIRVNSIEVKVSLLPGNPQPRPPHTRKPGVRTLDQIGRVGAQIHHPGLKQAVKRLHARLSSK